MPLNVPVIRFPWLWEVGEQIATDVAPMADDPVLSSRVHRTRRDLARQLDRRRHAELAFWIAEPAHGLNLLYGRPLSAEDGNRGDDILEAFLRGRAPKGRRPH